MCLIPLATCLLYPVIITNLALLNSTLPCCALAPGSPVFPVEFSQVYVALNTKSKSYILDSGFFRDPVSTKLHILNEVL